MIGCFSHPYPEAVADESDDCEQGASIPVRFPTGSFSAQPRTLDALPSLCLRQSKPLSLFLTAQP